MAGVATSKRRQYSLDGHLPKNFPTFFDNLCDPTGAQIVDANGEAIVEGVVGPSPSTLFSAIGSLFVLAWFFYFAAMIIWAYGFDPPTINELTLDTPKGFEAPMPDFALTLSLTPLSFYVASRIRQIKTAQGSSMTWIDASDAAWDEWFSLSEDEQILHTCNKSKCENRTLEYLWPVFRWESISGGFKRKFDVQELLGREDGIRFGDECGLNAAKYLEFGRWPVFCFLNSELPPERQRMLAMVAL